jgi:hypothetical protein
VTSDQAKALTAAMEAYKGAKDAFDVAEAELREVRSREVAARNRVDAAARAEMDAWRALEKLTGREKPR